jgi:hypothetical protein
LISPNRFFSAYHVTAEPARPLPDADIINSGAALPSVSLPGCAASHKINFGEVPSGAVFRRKPDCYPNLTINNSSKAVIGPLPLGKGD